MFNNRISYLIYSRIRQKALLSTKIQTSRTVILMTKITKMKDKKRIFKFCSKTKQWKTILGSKKTKSKSSKIFKSTNLCSNRIKSTSLAVKGSFWRRNKFPTKMAIMFSIYQLQSWKETCSSHTVYMWSCKKAKICS